MIFPKIIYYIGLLIFASNMSAIAVASELSKKVISSNWKPMTGDEKVLVRRFIGRTLTLDYLLLICNKTHSAEKDGFTILSEELSEKHREVVDKYIGSLYDIERQKAITKDYQLQTEKLAEESRIWGLEYFKKNGISNESPSLKSCSDAIKNFPLVPEF